MKLRTEIKKQLIELFKTGELGHCTDLMRKQDSFCLAGGLCELYRRETGCGEWVASDTEPVTYSFLAASGEVFATSPPPSVMEWAFGYNPGIKAERVNAHETINEIIDLNDACAHRGNKIPDHLLIDFDRRF